jgi:serine/threonine-protein kinase
MEGRLIGQYRVTGILGRGGMGIVYAARHTLLGRPAAVKVLLPRLSDDQEIVTRFFNEARAATAIRHPGIVEVYDFGWTDDGAAFIVMEHLQGETLRDRRKRGPMPWSLALTVTRQIAGALAAAHAKGIVHRDLKPDNVFLVPDSEVPGGERIKLLDFGIAKLADLATEKSVTRTGSVIGTPTYMAPEQCRGVAVDSRVDLYSLGCILFELIGSRPPFVGEGEGEVLAAHIHVPPPALGSLVRDLPHEIEVLVQRLLVKAPIDRVQSADEVIRLIDAASATLGGRRAIGSAPLPPLQPPRPPVPPAAASADGTIHSDTTLSSAVSAAHRAPPSPAKRRRLVLVGIAGSAIALAAVIARSVGGGDGEPAPAPAPIPYASAGSAMVPAPTPAPPSPTTSPASPPSSSAAAAAPSRTESSPPIPPKGSPPRPKAARQRPVPQEKPAPSAVDVADDSTALLAPSSTSKEKPAPSTVDVVIDSSPAGAKLVRDGQVIGTTPYRGTLPRADLAIRLSLQLSGYTQESFTVYAGGPITKSVQLVLVAKNGGVNPFK